MKFASRQNWFLAAGILTTGVLLFIGLDLLIFASSRNPALAAHLPRPLLEAARKIYLKDVRRVLQQQSDCARYDGELFYTLKPGSCHFSNPEFSTSIYVNSKGLRDSELALQGPEIIVLGDSFAMGWGVEQEQTFAKVLEKMTGLRTLNAGISSFGTVREKIILDRLDLRNLKAIVLQYCRNDEVENYAFFEASNRMNISKETEFQKLQLRSERTSRYRIGSSVKSAIEKPPKIADTGKNISPGDLFLNALQFSGSANLNKIPIYLIELNSYNTPVAEITHFVEAQKNSPLILRPIALDKTLNSAHFYVLDDHLRPEGHLATASAIAQSLKRDSIY